MDWPALRRPAALDRPGHSLGASAAGAGGGEMTMVSSKAAKDNHPGNALFGRIRQSLRAAAAVGGYHEIGSHRTVSGYHEIGSHRTVSASSTKSASSSGFNTKKCRSPVLID
jgi:hypothetical protein